MTGDGKDACQVMQGRVTKVGRMESKQGMDASPFFSPQKLCVDFFMLGLVEMFPDD